MANFDSETALVVENLTKDYPGRRAVDSLSFQVKRGTIHGFLGPNGAGKSTTMRMIAGLLTASSGKILINGVVQTPENNNLKNTIGLLPEHAPLYPEMSVRQYLEFVLKLHGKNQNRELDRLMNDLQLGEVSERLIGHLSRGYRQRVGLAQAMIYDPEIIIMDEPTTGLDPQSVAQWRDWIRKLTPAKTIIFSSHVLSEVEQLCDDITVIHQGKLKASGKLSDIQKMFQHGQKIKLEVGISHHLRDELLKQDFVESILHHRFDHKKLYLEMILKGDEDSRPGLISWLVSKNIAVYSLELCDFALEEIFLKLTHGEKV